MKRAFAFLLRACLYERKWYNDQDIKDISVNDDLCAQCL